jgi:hypothetical protein
MIIDKDVISKIKSVTALEKIDRVQQAFMKSPKKSVKHFSQQFSLEASSTYGIFQDM